MKKDDILENVAHYLDDVYAMMIDKGVYADLSYSMMELLMEDVAYFLFQDHSFKNACTNIEYTITYMLDIRGVMDKGLPDYNLFMNIIVFLADIKAQLERCEDKDDDKDEK